MAFKSSTKDFLLSGPKKREKEKCFCAWKGWLVTGEESCPGCLGRQDVKLGRPSIYFGKASSKFLICTWTCFISLSSSSPFLFCAFPASVPGRKRSHGPSPPGGPVSPQDTVSLCHLLMAKLLAEEGEAGGWFPLPKLVAVLPCWEALASSVSHTSACSLFL